MPQLASSESGIKLGETVSRRPNGEQKALGRGTFWPDREELAKSILIFVILFMKGWPDLWRQQARIMLGLQVVQENASRRSTTSSKSR